VKFPDTDNILNQAAHGTKVFDPPQSKQGPRKPMTIVLLNAIIQHLSPINLVHVAILAAATTAFFGIACLGKIVLKHKHAITHLPKRKNLWEDVLLRGHIITIVHVVMPRVEQLRTGACRVVVVVMSRGVTGLETGRGI
jgi:hypothetical protein